jgi:hypothetical protein
VGGRAVVENRRISRLRREPEGEHRDLQLPALPILRESEPSAGTADLPMRTPGYPVFADDGQEATW